MKEHPLLFSGTMVCALFEGKIQTRRIVSHVRGIGRVHDFGRSSTPGYDWQMRDRRECWNELRHSDLLARCPYGQPGDRLWVKETWAHYHTVNGVRRYDGRHFDEVSDGRAGYRADGHSTIADFREHVRMMSGCDLEAVVIKGDRWRPSIHMPRWASRITLDVTGIRVERLQSISKEDAIAEGLSQDEIGGYFTDEVPGCFADPIDAYRALWEHINGPGSWEADPFVWVIEFKPVTP